MTINKNYLFGISIAGALITSVVALIKGVRTETKVTEKLDVITEKVNKIAGTVDKSIAELSESISVDIPEEIVSKAMDKACNREATRAASTVISEAKSEIKNVVREAQDNLYAELKQTLTDEHIKQWKKKAGSVDVLSLKRKFVEEGKREILDTLSTDVESMKVEALSKIDSLVASVTNEINARTEFVRAVREGIKV